MLEKRNPSLIGIDDTYEGWLALALAILKPCSTDAAWRILSGAEERPKNRYDIETIEILREEGCTWKEIAEMYDSEMTSVHHWYTRHKYGRK